jgi:hypothetical protein
MNNDNKTYQCTFKTDFDEYWDKELFIFDQDNQVLRRYVRPKSKFPVLPVLPVAAEKIKGLREQLSKTRYSCFENVTRRPELHMVLTAIIQNFFETALAKDLVGLQKIVDALYEEGKK